MTRRGLKLFGGRALASAWSVMTRRACGNRYATTITDYKAAGRLVASHCLVSGLGHAWSGGGAGQANSDPGGPNASRMVWAFVARQFSALHSNAIIKIAN